MEITRCEVCPALDQIHARHQPCFDFQFISFAHRHKRVSYRRYPKLLYSYNQVVLACQNGHDAIEYDKELTGQVFHILRGDDVLPK